MDIINFLLNLKKRCNSLIILSQFLMLNIVNMIYSKIVFPFKQRLFWKNVKRRQKKWELIILNKESVEVTTTYKINYNLYKDDLLSEVIFTENFEWAEKEWIKNYLKPGMVFYDIGANIGFYTLIAAQQVGSLGKVYSLEPSRKTFIRLNKNISINQSIKKQITVYETAASDSNSETEMFVSDKDFHAWNSIAKPIDSSGFKIEKIRTEKLDVLFENNKWLPPDLIKIDVEGWEQYALNGAKEIIKKYQPTILIEFTKENLERAGTSIEKLKKQLNNMGYNLTEYIPRFNKLVPVNNWDFEHKNIIAIKRVE